MFLVEPSRGSSLSKSAIVPSTSSGGELQGVGWQRHGGRCAGAERGAVGAGDVSASGPGGLGLSESYAAFRRQPIPSPPHTATHVLNKYSPLGLNFIQETNYTQHKTHLGQNDTGPFVPYTKTEWGGPTEPIHCHQEKGQQHKWGNKAEC
jgi:hypothetical protein